MDWLEVPGSNSHAGEEKECQDPLQEEKAAHEVKETGGKEHGEKTDKYTEVLKTQGLLV